MAKRVYNRYNRNIDDVLPLFINKPHVIIYDDENIHYLTGCGASMDYEPKVMTYEDIDGSKTYFPLGASVTLSMDDIESADNIKLDETLMRRIAVYNKEAECKRLDATIAEKKEEIKSLDDILKDKYKRVDKLKKFVAELYDIDIDDYEDDYDD